VAYGRGCLCAVAWNSHVCRLGLAADLSKMGQAARSAQVAGSCQGQLTWLWVRPLQLVPADELLLSSESMQA
jgi:hypothetical protein